jgi:hypothetical protein
MVEGHGLLIVLCLTQRDERLGELVEGLLLDSGGLLGEAARQLKGAVKVSHLEGGLQSLEPALSFLKQRPRAQLSAPVGGAAWSRGLVEGLVEGVRARRGRGVRLGGAQAAGAQGGDVQLGQSV